MLGFEGWLRVCQTEKVRAVFWPEETTMQRHRSVKEVLGNSIERTQEKEQKKGRNIGLSQIAKGSIQARET